MCVWLMCRLKMCFWKFLENLLGGGYRNREGGGVVDLIGFEWLEVHVCDWCLDSKYFFGNFQKICWGATWNREGGGWCCLVLCLKLCFMYVGITIFGSYWISFALNGGSRCSIDAFHGTRCRFWWPVQGEVFDSSNVCLDFCPQTFFYKCLHA